MMRKRFGVDVSRYPLRLYKGNKYDVSVELDTHSKTLGKSEYDLGGDRILTPKVDPRDEIHFGSYSGSTLNFSLKGNLKEGASERQCWLDIHDLMSSLNDKFDGNGISIDTFVCMPFNGRQEIKLSNLLLDYKKGTSPQDIANAIGLIQEQVYNLLRQ